MRSIDKEEIFSEVYESNFMILTRIVWRITMDDELSEDIVQEALIRYYERIERLPHGYEARYWLIRVAKNLAFNLQKRKGRELKANMRTFFENTHHNENTGESNLLKEDTQNIVRAALAKLPEKMRMVLILKEYENMQYKEIAKVLQIAEGNVKVRVFRAREQLQKILEKRNLHVP